MTFGSKVDFILTEINGSLTSTSIFALIGAGRFFGAVSDIGLMKVSFFDLPPVSFKFLVDNVAANSTIPETSALQLFAIGLVVIVGVN